MFHVYTAVWRKKREFTRIASWQDGRLLPVDDIFPNIRYGLNGKHLTVVTLMVRAEYLYVGLDK